MCRVFPFFFEKRISLFLQGRVAVHYVDPASRLNFAFKCHRKQKTQIFAVNALDFHPRYGTFATAGSDGTCHFWDKDSKQRLKARRKPNLILENSDCCFVSRVSSRIGSP